MLDLATLILCIYIVVNADKGVYKETACNIALVTGIMGCVIGCITAAVKNRPSLATFYLLEAIIVFALRFAARHLARRYNEKQFELTENLTREIERRRRTDTPHDPIYTNESFDNDEETRFGKGGWTDPKL